MLLKFLDRSFPKIFTNLQIRNIGFYITFSHYCFALQAPRLWKSGAQMAPYQKLLDFIPVSYMTWYTFFLMFYHISGYFEQLTDLQLMLTINKYFLVDHQFCQTDEWLTNSRLTFFSFRP